MHWKLLTASLFQKVGVADACEVVFWWVQAFWRWRDATNITLGRFTMIFFCREIDLSELFKVVRDALVKRLLNQFHLHFEHFSSWLVLLQVRVCTWHRLSLLRRLWYLFELLTLLFEERRVDLLLKLFSVFFFFFHDHFCENVPFGCLTHVEGQHVTLELLYIQVLFHYKIL